MSNLLSFITARVVNVKRLRRELNQTQVHTLSRNNFLCADGNLQFASIILCDFRIINLHLCALNYSQDHRSFVGHKFDISAINGLEECSPSVSIQNQNHLDMTHELTLRSITRSTQTCGSWKIVKWLLTDVKQRKKCSECQAISFTLKRCWRNHVNMLKVFHVRFRGEK